MPQALWHWNRVRALTDGVRRLSDLPAEEARQELLDCCDHPAWAGGMLSQRPFKDREEVFEAAERFFGRVAREVADDWTTVRRRLERMLEL